MILREGKEMRRTESSLASPLAHTLRALSSSGDKLVDLFGNCYVERCGRCKRLWQRSSIVPKYVLCVFCSENNTDVRSSFFCKVLAECVMILRAVVDSLKLVCEMCEEEEKEALFSVCLSLSDSVFLLQERDLELLRLLNLFALPQNSRSSQTYETEEPFTFSRVLIFPSQVALVMGSSLTVSPFCELPTLARTGFIVCNLQVR